MINQQITMMTAKCHARTVARTSVGEHERRRTWFAMAQQDPRPARAQRLIEAGQEPTPTRRAGKKWSKLRAAAKVAASAAIAATTSGLDGGPTALILLLLATLPAALLLSATVVALVLRRPVFEKIRPVPRRRQWLVLLCLLVLLPDII